MTYEERNVIAAILVNLAVVAWFGSRIWTGWDGYAGEDGLVHWARLVLWVIPVSAVATAVAAILVNILYGIATGDGSPDTGFDERDRAIRLRGMVATVIVASAGFILGLGALAVGWGALAAFTIVLAGFALSDLVGNVLRLALYRRAA
ncbi:hypothetical protein [Wenxinia marina]|uniref:Uncharacterized protein n=1 Tax=Wenxinia marina DSM 24838 TaxID=1123501 RepID=A0A0D0Q2B7_9RHOB|nr:hypothetical protein [Wenxinia marina]KIQ68659.1 hypothetical protein Wenmar_02930 [Wenxinia marina DSM 24838]GGL67727.1 hypothetical protein GCM10011392_22730 [Wenxinia marina]